MTEAKHNILWRDFPPAKGMIPFVSEAYCPAIVKCIGK